MKIAIIGWGAAGMMVAAVIAEENNNHQIHLFEKNKRLGAKVLISGGGRCNVTTGYIKKQELQSKYIRGREFLQSAIAKFWPRKMRQRVESHGVPLKCEDDMRVFPKSDDGKDVVGIFEKIFDEKNVKVHFGEWVEKIDKVWSQFVIETAQGSYEYDAVVLTTGGNAYAHTGSSGDGYTLAKALWHSTTPLGPSLNSFLVREERIKTLSGISFNNAQIAYEKAKVVGPVLLTHFGTSGPAVFAFSAHSTFETIDKEHPLEIRLTPFAERNIDRWNKRMKEHTISSPKKQINTILAYEFPARFADALLASLSINPESKIADLSREQKEMIYKTLGDWISLHLIARRAGDEFVTAGWIDTDEINPETMESNICQRLFFAGEVINVDGVTGGYNLQACRSTAYVAGKALANKE